MAEPWSVVAEHPATGDPFGLVIEDDSTFAEAEYIARQILGTFRLTGHFLPTAPLPTTEGPHLFLYYLQPNDTPHLAPIWADSFADAELRLNILAADGILFMPSPG